MQVIETWRYGVLLVLLGVGPSAKAQDTRAWFGQAAFGPAYYSGGRYVSSDGWEADALLGRVVRSSSSGALVVVGTAGAMRPNDETLACPAVAAFGPCLSALPDVLHGALLVGVTRGTVHGSASLMAGPALIGSRDWIRLGLHVQADVTSPERAHVALVLSPQLLVAPNIGKRSLSVRSVRLGFRVR